MSDPQPKHEPTDRDDYPPELAPFQVPVRQEGLHPAERLTAPPAIVPGVWVLWGIPDEYPETVCPYIAGVFPTKNDAIEAESRAPRRHPTWLCDVSYKIVAVPLGVIGQWEGYPA